MASKTEEAISTLVAEVAVLKSQVQELRRETASVLELNKQMVAVQTQLAEAERVRQQWGQRGWGVMTVGLSAALSLGSAVVVSLFSYLLAVKK